MTGKPWPKREEALLRRLWPVTKTRELVKYFQNRSIKAIASRAKVLGVRKIIGGHKIWTRAEIRLLREIYPHKSTKMVARLLGRTVESVNGRVTKLNLHKSAEYMASLDHIECERLRIVGGPHRFHKGQVPANKGLRRPGWAPGRMRETQFKKGERTGAAQHNWLPVGTVKLNADGYLVRKIADEPNACIGAHSTNWEFVHRRVWEDAHGPIPEGHRIWWKDGNHENCALENLECLGGAEHIARTSFHKNTPPELASAILQLTWFKRKLRKAEGAIDAEKQTVGSAQSPVRDARSVDGGEYVVAGAAAKDRKSKSGRGGSADDHQLRKAGGGLHKGHRPGGRKERVSRS